MSKKIFILVAILFIKINCCFSQWITNHNPLFMPAVTKPAVYSSYTDPVFGTTVERISNCITQGFNAIVPDYSKRQAWNADESKMLLRSGDGEVLLCNGNNYSYIKTLSGVGGEDVFWHPTDPNTIYYSGDSILYTYNIISDLVTPVHVFSEYTWANTRGEGNMSLDGRYYAVVGQKYNYVSGETTFKDIVVYDLQASSEISVMPIPQDSIADFDWVSVSPLGNFVVVDYADETIGRYHGVEVYDLNMNFIWQKPLGAGHSDLGLDGSGNEVLVMDVYNADSNKTYIKKFNLADGQETTLLDLSPWFYLHISMRNLQRHDWCFVSTFDNFGRLTDDSLSWLPFEDEVFTLKLDGSGDVQRIAHHHSRRFSPSTPDPDNSVYWAEPHATVNRQGNKIIFGSNWRQNMSQQNSVDAYLVDFSSFLGMNDNSSPSEKFNIYPNPSDGKFTISCGNSDIKRIDIYNVLGEKIYSDSEFKGKTSSNINIFCSSKGIYFIRLLTDDEKFHTKNVVIH